MKSAPLSRPLRNIGILHIDRQAVDRGDVDDLRRLDFGAPRRAGVVDQHFAADQPSPGIDHHLADTPGLVVEQDILDGSNVPVARVDGASLESGDGEHHGTIPSSQIKCWNGLASQAYV